MLIYYNIIQFMLFIDEQKKSMVFFELILTWRKGVD